MLSRIPAGLFCTSIVCLIGCSSLSSTVSVVTPPVLSPLVAASASITFPATYVGYPATAQTVILTNPNATSVALSSITLGGTNAGSFSLSGNTCSTALTGNATCTLTLGFLPAATGALSAAVTVVNSSSSGTLSVPVSGTGNADPTIVNFTTATPLAVPSRSNFSGANMDPFATGTSYLDTNMQTLVQSMNMGWVRFPAGTADDPYQWNYGGTAPNYIGQTPTAWINQFSSYSGYSLMQTDQTIIGGKGGVNLPDFATFIKTQNTGTTGASGVNPTQAIGVINIFTDTTASAGALVKATAAAGIPVAVWELANEPVYYPTFYSSSSNVTQQAIDYLTWVKPYAAAIKAASPSAKVAVWVDNKDDTWTQGVVNYANTNGVFWDELYTHSYPGANASGYTVLSDQIAFYNGFLQNNTNTVVDSLLANAFGSNMKPVEFSEFNINPLQGTIYDGLFIAEFTMRLSSDSLVTNVGMHVLYAAEAKYETAISTTNDYVTQCEAAYAKGIPINTASAGYNFGYFLTPAGLAMQIMNGDINTSDGMWPTVVTNSPIVQNIVSSQYGTMAAIYAQAYEYAGTTKHILLTNKASTPQIVLITQNGVPLTQTLSTSSVGGTDPTAMNTAASPINVQIVPGTSVMTVTVPAYGVMDVSWVQ